MAVYTTRRLPKGSAIRLVGRDPNDYAQELQELLDLLIDHIVGAIPGGFNNEAPSDISIDILTGSGAAGGESSGWAAADHQHALDPRLAGWTDDGNAVRLTSAGDLVGVGTPSPHSKVHVAGPIALAYVLTAVDLVLDGTHSTVAVDTGAGDRIITLPSAVGIEGRVYTIKRITA